MASQGPARLGAARQGRARRGTAWRGLARPGWDGPGQAWHGMAWHGLPGGRVIPPPGTNGAGHGRQGEIVTFLDVVPKLTAGLFERQVTRYAQAMGWRCRPHPGASTLILVRRPRVVFAILKTSRVKLTDDEIAWICELRACGQEVHVWRPYQTALVIKTLH